MTVVGPITIEEFMRLPGDGRFDLIDGVVFHRPPAGAPCGRTIANLIGACLPIAASANLRGFAGAAIVLGRNPDTALSPSVCYVALSRLPPRDQGGGPLEVAPDLAIDVRAPSERGPFVRRRVSRYLAAGARLVWVIDPERRKATVYHPGVGERVLAADDRLEGEDVLPGLSVRVGDLLD